MRIEFVTPLAPETCIATLKRRVRHTQHPPLTLRQHDHRVQIVALAWRERHGRALGWWRFRVDGELVATQAGTRFSGKLSYNRQFNTALLSMGGCSGVFSALGVAFAAYEPAQGTFPALLALLFLGLFVVFFASYLRATHQEGAALLDDLYTWLVLPETA